MRKLKVAVDIGGTFTDLVAVRRRHAASCRGQVALDAAGFIDGVMNALEKAGIRPEEVARFKHGSTIATNAIIERTRGRDRAASPPSGFRDVLAAGRANRPDLFNSELGPLRRRSSARRHVLEVDERIDYEGNVLARARRGRRPRRRPQVPRARASSRSRSPT